MQLLMNGYFFRTIFSMLSDKTKDYTRTLCIFKGFHLSVNVSDSLMCDFTINGNDYYFFSFKNGEVIVRKRNQENITFTAPPFDERSWLDHFFHIFNPSAIYLMFQYYNRKFDEPQFQIVQECLKGQKIGYLFIGLTSDPEMKHIVSILNAFLPVDNVYVNTNQNLQLNSNQLSTLRQIMPWNFKDLTITVNIPLNDLLLLNCVSLKIRSKQLTEKDLNLFLKYWIAGLKPELEYLNFVGNGPSLNQQNVLEGIPYQLGPVEREFELYQMDTEFGGIDIQMAGGAKATLVFCPRNAQFTVTLHNSNPSVFMSGSPSLCKKTFKTFQFAYKFIKDLLLSYHTYLFLAIEAVQCLCFIHFAYPEHKTPQAALSEFFADPLQIVGTILLAGVGAFLLDRLFFNRKQYTIRSFCAKRYLMATAMISLAILLPVHSIIGLYCDWTENIMSVVIQFIAGYLVFNLVDQLYELHAPVYYELSENTKITTAQKASMVLFLVISEIFYIGLSFLDLDPLADEYVASGFFYTTRFICPIINILAIPIIWPSWLITRKN
eukprot:NP_001254038.1 F-box B protein [Caenorhabditis elegans]